jgi:serine/tyrosine/threonine adenylyltransferase
MSKIHNSYHQLGSDFYCDNIPDKIKNPTLIAFNKSLAKELGISDEKAEEFFSGNKLLLNSKPIALAYAGHQFGHFVPQLGDGRAVLLGEVYNKKQELFDIQLKGSGRTFFSRNGDGKCPLDAAIRECLISEAMYHLKISTARSLALVKSDDFIYREEKIPAAIVTRIAKSHIRIGTFEYFSARNDLDNLKKLADYTINRHFPKYNNHQDKYLYLLKSVMKLQADLVSDWMKIGFIHGVMNTDNITISGQTIDFGPCAFMDEYESYKVFSYIDQKARYAFSNQKNIILWNLIKFAEAILPLIDENIKKAVKIAGPELNKFQNIFENIYLKKMAKKIGIFKVKDYDMSLIGEFLEILEENKVDFTNGFRILSSVLQKKEEFYVQNNKYLTWQQKWQDRIALENIDLEDISKKMDKINPILIPRNHIIAKIIARAVNENNYDDFHKFLEAAKKPFTKNAKYSEYYQGVKNEERVRNTFCGT